jgi:hypothetical protein
MGIDPVLLIFSRDEDNETGFDPKVGLVQLDQFMSTEMGKSIVAELMQDVIREDGIDVVVMVTEAWLATLPTDSVSREEALKIRPSERPDKEEVVLLNILTKTDQYIGSSKIVREPSPTLEALRIFASSNDAPMEGMFIRNQGDAEKVH